MQPLERFVEAQKGTYEVARTELEAGRKRTHWMWFIFPQLAGLGTSAMASLYALSSKEEAKSYADHPLLGERLRECTRLVNAVQGRSAEDIFGHPDWMKFRSCMTLFSRATDDKDPFIAALEKYFDGREDEQTLRLLDAL